MYVDLKPTTTGNPTDESDESDECDVSSSLLADDAGTRLQDSVSSLPLRDGLSRIDFVTR